MNNDSAYCVYCGDPNPSTRDHIPPKNLFATPLPSNLVTVPCCVECHKGTSKDDEYFRDMLTMRTDTFDNQGVQQVLQKVFRSYLRPEKRIAFSRLVESIREFDAISKAGLHLGKKGTYKVDKSRLDRVAERIARGMYWYEEKKPFPYDGMIKAYTVDALDLTGEKAEQMAKMLEHSKEKVIRLNTFKYIRAKSSLDYFELWLLVFYDRVQFLVFLRPGDKINAAFT